MLKHLYKTFLISVISGSLLSINPSIALAASTTTDSNGVITAKQSHKFDAVSDTDMMASLAMLSAGFITARMAVVYNKPISADAMIAAAAGAAFIAGEITSNVKFKGKMKEMTVEVEHKNDGTVNEEQIKRLEDLKKSYEEAKKTTNFKKTLQLASAAGFGVAAATAGVFAYMEAASVNACVANLQALSPVCTPADSNVALFLKTLLVVDAERQFPTPSIKSEARIAIKKKVLDVPLVCAPKTPADASMIATALPLAQTNCSATVTMLKKHQVFTYKLEMITKNSNEIATKTFLAHLPELKNIQPVAPNPSFFEKILNVFIPKADASWLSMLGLGGGVAAAFAVVTLGWAQQIDLWIYVPFNRSIIFGVLAGIAFMASQSSAGVVDKLDANIKKIDNILADLNKESKGIKAQNLNQQQIAISTVGKGAATGVSFSTDNTVKTPCMTSNNSTNCAALANQLSSMPGFANLPDSFKDIANQVVSVGDGVSGTTGISGSTLSSAENLGTKQNAIARLVKSTQTKLNNVSKGKLDAAKATDKFNKSMATNLKKSLEKSGYTATGLMSSIGGTQIDSSAKALAADSDLNKAKPGAANAINLQAGSGEGKDSEMLKLDFSEQAPSESLSMGEVTASSAAPEYDMKSTEINGENGPSLFELISGRYFKSGYPKLLEEEPSKN